MESFTWNFELAKSSIESTSFTTFGSTDKWRKLYGKGRVLAPAGKIYHREMEKFTPHQFTTPQSISYYLWLWVVSYFRGCLRNFFVR